MAFRGDRRQCQEEIGRAYLVEEGKNIACFRGMNGWYGDRLHYVLEGISRDLD